MDREHLNNEVALRGSHRHAQWRAALGALAADAAAAMPGSAPRLSAPLSDGRSRDVAVLQIEEADPPVAPVEYRFEKLPRAPTTGSVRGFPPATKGPQLPGGRIEHDQPGRVGYTSLTRRALTIDATGRHELDVKSDGRDCPAVHCSLTNSLSVSWARSRRAGRERP
jgi:hypothetical protein